MRAGMSAKELILFYGRRTGKSVWSAMVDDLMEPNITVLDSAEVDGNTWHTEKLNMLTAKWLRGQDRSM